MYIIYYIIVTFHISSSSVTIVHFGSLAQILENRLKKRDYKGYLFRDNYVFLISRDIKVFIMS